MVNPTRLLRFFFLLVMIGAISVSLSAQSVNALSFDGSSQSYVNIPSSAALTTTNFTVEAWVKIGSTWNYDGVIDKGRNVTNNWWIVTTDAGVTQSQGVIFGVRTSAGNIEIVTTWGNANWHHVAMTFDGTTLRGYVDGNLIGTNSGGTFTPVQSTVRVGCRIDASTPQPFDGQVDEVRIWNTALSATTLFDWKFKSVTASHPNYSSLKGYWKLNEGSGTSTADASGSGLTGTLTNGPTWIASTAPLDVNVLSAGTSWESGTWGFGRVPTATEDAQITSGLTVSVNSSAVCKNLSVGSSTASATTVTVNNGASLSLSGNLIVNPSNAADIFTLDAGAGSVSVAGTPQISSFGICRVEVGTGDLNFTAVSPMSLSGGELRSNSSQSDITFFGPFTLAGGSLAFGGGNWIFNNGLTVTTGIVSSIGGSDQVTIGMQLTANQAIDFGTSSTVLFNGPATISPSSLITFGNLTVGAAATVNCSGNIAIANTMTVNGVFIPSSSAVVSGGTLTGSGTVQVTSTGALGGYQSHLQKQYTAAGGMFTDPDLTVDYAGTNQTLSALNYVYGKLKVSGSITNTHGPVTVNNSFTVTGTYMPVNSSMTLSGTISNSGTLIFSGLTISGGASTSGSFSVAGDFVVNSGDFVAPAGTVTMTGSSWRLLTPASWKFTFYNLTIANTSAMGVEADVTVTGALTVNTGASFNQTSGAKSTFSGGGWTIVNNGTIQFAHLTIAGTPFVQPSANFSFTGDLTVNAGVTFAPTSGTISTLGTGWRIVNSGTLTFNGLTVTDSPATDPVTPFAVKGILAVTGGIFAPIGMVTMNNGSIVSSAGLNLRGGLTIAAGAAVTTASSFSLNASMMVNSSGTFTATAGTITMSGSTIANSGTLTFSGLTIPSNASVGTSNNFSVTGTFTVSGGASFTASSGTATISGGSIVNVGTLSLSALTIASGSPVTTTSSFSVSGAFSVASGGSFTASGGTITKLGSTITNSGTLTFSGLTVTGAVTTTGTFAITGALLVNSGSSFTASAGTVTMSGSSISNLGTLSFSGLTIAPSATVASSSSFTVNGAMTIGTGASFTASAGTITKNGGSIGNSGALTFSGLTVASNVTTTSSFTVTGTFTVGFGAGFNASGGTLTKSGGSIVNSGSCTFSSLSVNGSVTTSSSFTVSNALSVAGSSSLIATTGTITKSGGSISNSGTLTLFALTIPAASTVTTSSNFSLNGSLTIGNTANFSPSGGTITFGGNNTTFSNSGTCVFNNVTLAKNAGTTLTLSSTLTVNGVLTLTSGSIATGSNLVDIVGTASTNVTGTGGVINGKIRRALAATNAAYLFNDAATSIAFMSGTNASSITVESFPNTSVPYGNTAQNIKRYYTITNTGGSGQWSLSLSYRNASPDERNGITETALKMKLGDGSQWTTPWSSGQTSVTNPSSSGRVVAIVNGFGTFAIGGVPTVAFSSSSLDFGYVGQNLSETDSVTVTNNGPVSLSISSILSSNASVFDVSPSSMTIAAGGSGKFYTTFLPVTVGAQSASIAFVSDASTSPDTFTVSGTGFLPTISSFSPTAAAMGASVTIQGTFLPVPASNIISFGGVRGTVTGGSSTQLTVTVPAGAAYRPITVTAAGLTHGSTASFTPTYATSLPVSSSTFSTYSPVASMTGANKVLTGDLDGDGTVDLIYVRPSENKITFLRNISTTGSLTGASFAAPESIVTSASLNRAAIGDVNGDGKPDLVTIHYTTPGLVSLYLNTGSPGTISFDTARTFTIGNNPYSVALGDIDQDRRTDIVTTVIEYSYNTSQLCVYLSVLRDTSSTSIPSYSETKILTDIRLNYDDADLGDYNQDGKLDIAIFGTNNNTGYISIWTNASTPGAIGFINYTNLNSRNFNYPNTDLASIDLNGDNLPEFLARDPSTDLAIFRNATGGTYGSYQELPIGILTMQMVGSDLTGDGKNDLIIANNSGFSVFPSTSTASVISLGTNINVASGGGTTGVAAVDLDGDGLQDVAVANGGGGVLRNKPLAAEPSAQPSGLVFTNVKDTSFTVSWTKGDGDSTLLLIRSGSAVNATISDAAIYSADSVFGAGTLIGTGNYVIAVHGGNSVTVTGLQPSTVYHLAAYSFNGGREATQINYRTLTPATASIGTDALLPVELTEFTASSRRLDTELKWKTTTEVNNHGFEVERRSIGNGTVTMDQWYTAGFVEGNGNSNTVHAYSFTDRVTSAGKYSYRLKQIDNDGKYFYSSEIDVTVGSVPAVFALEQNYPNPFNPNTTIGFTLRESGPVDLRVFDTVGREVATLVNEYLETGVYHQRTFNASRCASGIYFARLISSNRTMMKKMVLMK